MMVPFIVILPGLLGLALLPVQAGRRGRGGGHRRRTATTKCCR